MRLWPFRKGLHLFDIFGVGPTFGRKRLSRQILSLLGRLCRLVSLADAATLPLGEASATRTNNDSDFESAPFGSNLPTIFASGKAFFSLPGTTTRFF